MGNGTIKKVFVVMLMLSLSYVLFLMPNEASAASEQQSKTLKQGTSNLATGTSNKVTPSFVNDFRNVKKKVEKWEEWSSFKRVSQNLNTYGAKGGSISADRSVSFSPTVSGDIGGLNISLGGSKSSSKSYSLDVGKNRQVYMGYRVRYAVEKGENHRIDIVTGATLSKKKYKVKKLCLANTD
ncbi:hypothetical protein P4534_26430 [Peribacillus butanolivorans]|uniref:hypothetical protein n=1 Tax=Peribacillus butanolivorans TaxID=421767 RepID=UPI002E1F948D|nr:hypothetical protein [Peribacillus butanolivorans]